MAQQLYSVPNPDDPNYYEEVPITGILKVVLTDKLQTDLRKYFSPLNMVRPGDFYYVMFPQEGSVDRVRWYHKRDIIDLVKSSDFQTIQMPKIIDAMNEKIPKKDNHDGGDRRPPHQGHDRTGQRNHREVTLEDMFKMTVVQNLDSILQGFNTGGFNIREFLLANSNLKLRTHVMEMESEKFWSLYFWSLLSQSAYNQYFCKQKNYADVLKKLVSVPTSTMPEFGLFSRYLSTRAFEIQTKHLNFYGEPHITPSVDLLPAVRSILDLIIRLPEFKNTGAKYEVQPNRVFSPWAKIFFFPHGKS